MPTPKPQSKAYWNPPSCVSNWGIPNSILGIPKLCVKLGNSQQHTGNSQVVCQTGEFPTAYWEFPVVCQTGEFPTAYWEFPSSYWEFPSCVEELGNSQVVWRNWGIPNNILGIPKFCGAFWEFPVHDREFPLTSAIGVQTGMVFKSRE
ncbi:hypothetical protein K435DRAFT_792794 [Dendrothele bispora CBS 962.96]|uniref:Uncharacterized protein n=1 Tax=Dendrothele bispora (strain CBS 962.96) TaxID=1314807 RepID=A0A4V4HHC6_DENBC|nr:hypothetical protein K435DRAFT_792794 [Dendrothele bispora CBS 962.96]